VDIYLAGELLPTHPWDQLLALAILGAVLSIPLIVKIGIMLQKRRTAALQEQFGDEYDALIQKHGDRRAAERELLRRLQSSGR
jgi:hypothetical protein